MGSSGVSGKDPVGKMSEDDDEGAGSSGTGTGVGDLIGSKGVSDVFLYYLYISPVKGAPIG